MDHFFYASHIRHNFSLYTDTYIDELVEIFLKLSMKTVQVHLIIWMTLEKLYKAVSIITSFFGIFYLLLTNKTIG